ncbi:MAG: hypothetical protein IPJ65_16915 [Archangiaceae bacterium]|nr:hypothetical protein [Archangiaceae bacterium]
MSAPHPSRLALDRLALGQGDAAARAHADSCAQCAAHLRALSVQSGQPDFVHPSSLALDRFALGIADAPTQAHTAACAQCAAHLTEVQRELPVPTWVRELEGPRAPAWPWLRPLLAMGAVAAVLVVALAIPRPRPDELTAKGVGTPQVQVWVNREATSACGTAERSR